MRGGQCSSLVSTGSTNLGSGYKAKIQLILGLVQPRNPTCFFTSFSQYSEHANAVLLKGIDDQRKEPRSHQGAQFTLQRTWIYRRLLQGGAIGVGIYVAA